MCAPRRGKASSSGSDTGPGLPPENQAHPVPFPSESILPSAFPRRAYIRPRWPLTSWLNTSQSCSAAGLVLRVLQASSRTRSRPCIPLPSPYTLTPLTRAPSTAFDLHFTPRLPPLPSSLSVSSCEVLKPLQFTVSSLSLTLKTLIFWAHWYKRLLELFASE